MSVFLPLNAELLVELELVKRAKYAYLRTLDLKMWSELSELLTDDVTSSYSDGKYTFNGTEYQLECNEVALNNSLHGHVYNKPFEVTNIETSEEMAAITFSYTSFGAVAGFPFSYKLDIIYTYAKSKLVIDFKVENIGEKEFPFGLGWHPYFKAENLAESKLKFKGDKKYFLNEKNIPQQETLILFNHGRAK